MNIALIFALVAGGACCVTAAGKGRNPVAWLALGTLFPVVALVVVVILPSVNEPGAALPVKPERATLNPAARAHLQTTTLDALDRLAAIKERGAITTADYDAKKAELLARL